MTATITRPRRRIYLAGPEVFLPKAREVGEAKAAMCAAAGFDGVFPLDAALTLDGLAKAEQAQRIYRADVDLMRGCDLMIGNLTPFRGVSMDSGTAFEAGFMRALGRPVLGYSHTTLDYRARADAYRATIQNPRPVWPDADRPDIAVEDFGLAENLMIAAAIRESGFAVICRQVPPGHELTDLTGLIEAVSRDRR